MTIIVETVMHTPTRLQGNKNVESPPSDAMLQQKNPANKNNETDVRTQSHMETTQTQKFTKGRINSPPQCAHFNNPSTEPPTQNECPGKEPIFSQSPHTDHRHLDELPSHEDDSDSDSIKTPKQIAEFLIGRLTAIVSNASDDETKSGGADTHTSEYSAASILGHPPDDEEEKTGKTISPNIHETEVEPPTFVTRTKRDPVLAM